MQFWISHQKNNEIVGKQAHLLDSVQSKLSWNALVISQGCFQGNCVNSMLILILLMQALKKDDKQGKHRM